MLSIVGAVIICSLFVVAPNIMFLMMCKKEGKSLVAPKAIVSYFILAIGAMCFFVGTYQAFYDLIQKMSPDEGFYCNAYGDKNDVDDNLITLPWDKDISELTDEKKYPGLSKLPPYFIYNNKGIYDEVKVGSQVKVEEGAEKGKTGKVEEIKNAGGDNAGSTKNIFFFILTQIWTARI